MKDSLRLSLVIPAYNSENTITKLLLSINDSRFKNFSRIEVIVIDDLSTDKTAAVIKHLSPSLKFKIKLISQTKNTGPAKARNLGVKNAKGTYVLFLDSDVELHRQTLAYAFSLAKTGRARAFTGIWDFKQKSRHFFPQFKALRDWSYWIMERQKNSHFYLFSTRIAGIEKKLFREIGGFNEDYTGPTVEDIELTYKIEQVAKIKFSHRLIVKHEFEDFWPIAVKYFKRSRDWIQLYSKRQKFDPVATSKKEAFKSLAAGFLIFFGFFSTLFKPTLIVTLIFFIIFAFADANFWYFLLKKKGVVFLLKSIPVSIILYLIIDLGVVYGFLLTLKNSED